MEDSMNEDNIHLGCALEFFSEYEEVTSMVENLHHIYADARKFESSYDKFRYIMNTYQEQPHLLDSHLDSLLQQIFQIVRNKDHPVELKHKAFKYLYSIIKVRGFKIVVNHLPHEVADLEPVLSLLEEQDPTDKNSWETRYCLLLWLSIIVMIPFNMSCFDSGEGSESTSMTERILKIIKQYLMVSDKCCDGAVFLSTKFINRADIKTTHLSDFLDWAMSLMTASNQEGKSSQDTAAVWKRIGPLSAVAAILKHGKREDLLPFAVPIINRMEQANYKNDNYRLTQKHCIKIIQRAGLTMLPIQIAVWRYKRGCRSLAVNLSGGDPGASLANNEIDSNESEGDSNIHIPDEIEQVIDTLLGGLTDSDITVRWSAAKGVGRITNRLPKYFADEVVATILDLLNPKKSNTAWHGACLALAELGKRGLLLPERLKEVVPLIVKALVYDEPHGAITVGSSVRDAACYVAWSFARAYDVELLRPYINQIASALLVVTCFDREINCRRAASAAFQEHVGRQGTFPHGIDILTNADYFAVGVRNNAYLKISVDIAQFEEYTFTLIDHLVEKKLNHVDIAIRELAAKALHNLTSKAPAYMSKQVLPQVFKKVDSINLNERHGAILAAGEIFLGLALEDPTLSLVAPELISKAGQLVRSIEEKQQFKGYSGELMKQSCCCFIQRCSQAKLQFQSLETISDWQRLINECLSHEVPLIRTHASEALAALMSEYYVNDSTKINTITVEYTKKLSDSHEVTRMGYAQALGTFDARFLKDNELLIINALMDSLIITPITSKWSESRRDTIKALTSLWNRTVTTEEKDCPSREVFLSLTDKFLECYLVGCQEYTIESRGDIGAWVREASMSGLQSVLVNLASIKPELIKETHVARAMKALAQQSVERIERTRAHAGKIFFSLLHNVPRIPHIPNHEDLLEIFDAERCANMEWLKVEDVFRCFIKLLSFSSYQYHVMLGLIMSVGGLTEQLVKFSTESLLEFLQLQSKEKLTELASTIIAIFRNNVSEERITTPMMIFLDRVLSSNYFRAVLEDESSTFARDLLELTKAEMGNSKTVPRLNNVGAVFCQLIQVRGPVSKQALTRLSMLLCHRFLSLRKTVSTRFYESLVIFSEECNLSEEKLEEALTVLSETEWDKLSINEVREIRNKLCLILDIPVPKVVQKVQ
ncbi:unnamed protein product [Bemisia tabaci]|uniref:Tubulin-specific chaperone D n=1 Tax=Bemisia tabaci TaxID=7038 RepID=A0A9P0AMP9_BEMTA|nr:unnamed protein product [Bemisia tabaci]